MSRAAAVLFALLGFAANSVLCRMALREAHIDPASFTSIRLLAGAVTLWLLLRVRRGPKAVGGTWAPVNAAGGALRPVKAAGGTWTSAFVLLTYAIAFSFAYVKLTAGTGALLLFGAVQVVMIGVGFARGERIDRTVVLGWLLAVVGLTLLLLPGTAAPAPSQAASMLVAGIAWGTYSLRGRRSADALGDTAGNFLRSLPFAIVISAVFWASRSADPEGVVLAILSGSVASGLGYAAWYTALPRLRAITAANAQLSVPVIAALAGIVLFGEPITVRLALSSVLVLGGTGLAVRRDLTARK